jgi:hypothetical protein
VIGKHAAHIQSNIGNDCVNTLFLPTLPQCSSSSSSGPHFSLFPIMKEALLPSVDDVLSSSSYDLLPSSLESLTPTSLRALPFPSPLSSRLFHSPFSSLSTPRSIVDYVFTLGINAGIAYGVGWLQWRLRYPDSPVPVISPFAEEGGRWSRGSLFLDLFGTLAIMTVLITVLQGSILQLEVSRAMRRPIHASTLSIRPFSFFPALLLPALMSRIRRILLQFTLPCILITWLFCVILCAGVGGGIGSCSLDSDTTLAVKIAWTVSFLALYYPLLVVGSINSAVMADARLTGYINKVREKEAVEPQLL